MLKSRDSADHVLSAPRTRRHLTQVMFGVMFALVCLRACAHSTMLFVRGPVHCMRSNSRFPGARASARIIYIMWLKLTNLRRRARVHCASPPHSRSEQMDTCPSLPVPAAHMKCECSRQHTRVLCCVHSRSRSLIIACPYSINWRRRVTAYGICLVLGVCCDLHSHTLGPRVSCSNTLLKCVLSQQKRDGACGFLFESSVDSHTAH